MAKTGYTYRCSKCGRTDVRGEDKPAPVCCEEVMVKDPLPQCTTADHPEMVRNTDEGEPCDDGRGKEH
ncbi:MAG TPA: hypothetical protein PKG60_13020 [Spirochaetota bacterium]|jgi:hypothetical protein|nr:hypothetical protein [Spirochaetota bacterium]HPS87274.1 hypothetical protein [Spirochaetota bacterium]